LNSPGFQAGDEKRHESPSPFRRLVDGGKGREKQLDFIVPGLKAGAILIFVT